MSRKRPQPPVKPFKKKPNPLKAAKVTEIDYKDVALLRKFISDRYKKQGIDFAPENIIITNGSQQALDMVAATLIDPLPYATTGR